MQIFKYAQLKPNKLLQINMNGKAKPKINESNPRKKNSVVFVAVVVVFQFLGNRPISPWGQCFYGSLTTSKIVFANKSNRTGVRCIVSA